MSVSQVNSLASAANGSIEVTVLIGGSQTSVTLGRGSQTVADAIEAAEEDPSGHQLRVGGKVVPGDHKLHGGEEVYALVTQAGG